MFYSDFNFNEFVSLQRIIYQNLYVYFYFVVFLNYSSEVNDTSMSCCEEGRVVVRGFESGEGGGFITFLLLRVLLNSSKDKGRTVDPLF